MVVVSMYKILAIERSQITHGYLKGKIEHPKFQHASNMEYKNTL